MYLFQFDPSQFLGTITGKQFYQWDSELSEYVDPLDGKIYFQAQGMSKKKGWKDFRNEFREGCDKEFDPSAQKVDARAARQEDLMVMYAPQDS